MVSLDKFMTEYSPVDYKPLPNEVWGPFVVEEEALGAAYVGTSLQVSTQEISWFSGDRQHVRSIDGRSAPYSLETTKNGHFIISDVNDFKTIIRPLTELDGQLIFRTSTTDVVYVQYLAAMTTVPFVEPMYEELMKNMGMVVTKFIYPPIFSFSDRDQESKKNTPMTAAADSCPIATKDIGVNIANRQQAIEAAAYGPLNPKDPNVDFWRKKAERWNTTYAEARKAVCGNCSAFIRTPSMLDCISSGLQEKGTDSSGGWDTIEAGELGYCEAFDFKCAASRTCDAWIVGGPITEEK